MLNRVMLMGRLTKDPELRYAGDTPVASFSVAVDRDYKGRDGEKQADFFNCVAWRHTGEFIDKYFSKGKAIVIDGRLQSRNWEDKDGNKRVSIEVVVDSAYFGDSKKDGGESEYAEKPRKGVSVEYSEPTGAPEDAFEDAEGELPFE